MLSNEVVVVDTVVKDRFMNCKEIVDDDIALRLKGNRHRLPRHVGNIIVGEYIMIMSGMARRVVEVSMILESKEVSDV